MKIFSLQGLRTALGATALLVTSLGTLAATNVGVSVEISQPGVHGRIDIGQFPRPEVISQQPVVIVAPPPQRLPQEPVYMWVPPGHQRHWNRYCGRYNACDRVVYFVRDDWYRGNVYRVDDRRDRRDDRREWRDERRWERDGGGGDRRDHHHGHGHGRGHD
ncbi:MAG: hypothetical protein RLY71_1548 [Pseudomonadota bacterium]|jgi:hypothetical protein